MWVYCHPDDLMKFFGQSPHLRTTQYLNPLELHE
jgi:hypothetical protein